MTSPLGVALLGYGRIAQLFHLPILRELEGIDLRVVAEPDPGRRQEAGRRCAAEMVADHREAISDPSVDAVVACLPSGLHADAATRALESGKHLYLEKPIATSLEDGDRVLETWRARRLVGMVGFNHRHDTVLGDARAAVRAGLLGTVTGARIQLGAAPRDVPDWKRRRTSGGGVLLDLGSHAVDLSRYLLGSEVRAVTASVASTRNEDDTAALTLELDDGRLVVVHLTSTCVQEARCELLGERGCLVVDRYARTCEVRPPKPAYSAVERSRRAAASAGSLPGRIARAVRRPTDGRSHRAALEAFAHAARGGGRATPDLQDGHRSLVAVLAAEEAARTGRRVPVGTDGP